MNLPERLGGIIPSHIPASLFLHEGDANHRVTLWVDGSDPEDILIMPTPRTPAGYSWQNAIIEALLENKKLNLRTADDVC